MNHATNLSPTAASAYVAQFAVGAKPARARSTGGELTEEDLQAIDLAYHQKKTSGSLDRERVHAAVQYQVQMLRCEAGL